MHHIYQADRAARPRQQRSRMLISIQLALVTLAATTVDASLNQAYAQVAERVSGAAPVRFDVPAGPLASALNRVADQANLLLSAPGALTAGKSSPGVQGLQTPESALRAVLSGSGLEAVRQADGSWSVRAMEAPSRQGTLPGVVVNANAVKEDAYGPTQGLLARRSASGTKTDTPIIEIPQSISVVGRQQMEEQKAQSMQDALGYSAGLMTGISAKSPLFDDTLSIRGFEANPQMGSFYRDGMRYMLNLYNGKQEIYGLERIEVLKGPSSILYGAAAPGGIINTVTKRPPATPLHEINLEYGNHNRKQVSGDFGGPLDNEGVWSWRLTALKRESGTDVNYGRDDRTYIAPALT